MEKVIKNIIIVIMFYAVNSCATREVVGVMKYMDYIVIGRDNQYVYLAKDGDTVISDNPYYRTFDNGKKIK